MYRNTRVARTGSGLFAALLLLSASALADTYSIRTVANSDAESFVSANDYGDYTINVNNRIDGIPECAASAGGCYLTYYASSNTSVYSATIPTLAVDPAPTPGPGCGPTPVFARFAFCNNGHEIFNGFYDTPSGPRLVLTDGPDPVRDAIGSAFLVNGILTPNGNFFFTTGFPDQLRVALDLSTTPAPEPGSLVLAGSGLLGMLAAAARRRFA